MTSLKRRTCYLRIICIMEKKGSLYFRISVCFGGGCGSRVILISLFLRYPILHAPMLCHLPQGFQNFKTSKWVFLAILVGGFLFYFFKDIQFCMLPCFATCLKVFKTVFVFALRPFLPMSVLFFGFNGNFNGKMTKIKKMAKNHFSGVQKIVIIAADPHMSYMNRTRLRQLIWRPATKIYRNCRRT